MPIVTDQPHEIKISKASPEFIDRAFKRRGAEREMFIYRLLQAYEAIDALKV